MNLLFCVDVRRDISLRKENEQTETFFKMLRWEIAIPLWKTKFYAVVKTAYNKKYLSKFHPVNIFPSHMLKINFNIILRRLMGLSYVPFFGCFPIKTLFTFIYSPPACSMPCRSQYSPNSKALSDTVSQNIVRPNTRQYSHHSLRSL